MASFCIMRTAKLRTDGNVAGSISHALRDRETPNADPNVENWTNLNVKGEDGKSHIPENAFDQAMARFRKTLPKKIGKGRVPCVELMMTVSPEVMTRPDFKITSYLNDCDQWAEETFGKENVFLKVHHKDEKTPHSSIFIVPKVIKKYKDGHTEEVLAAKQWLGGREKLSKLQDDFYETVGKKYGLERGIKNSKAKHQTQKKYYAKINQLEKELAEFSANLVENVPSTRGMFSTIIDQDKLNPYLQKQIETLKPYFEKLAKAEDIEKKYKALQESFNEELNSRVETVKTKLKDKFDLDLKQATANLTKEKDDLYNAIHSSKLVFKGLKGEEITCQNGLLEAVKRASAMAIENKEIVENWRNTSAEELIEIANAYKKYGVNNWEDYEQAKSQSKGCGRGLGGFSYSD